MRRHELQSTGTQVPVLATVALGPLPQPGNWARRLELLGMDVITTGAAVDDSELIRAAVAAVPHRPVLARAGDPEALVAAGAHIVVMDGVAPSGAYAFRSDEVLVIPVAADAPAENANDVARDVLLAARRWSPSALWVVAPDLSGVPEDVVEAKLRAMAEGARMARMWLAKEQFDTD